MRIGVLVASTRPGRSGRAIGEWVVQRLSDRADLVPVMLDLAEFGLPLLDEPNHPSEHRYVHDHTKAWSAAVDACDGFVFVVPEYNRSMPAALKNALDYLYVEWQHKPVAFVSYSGGVSGGTRAVEMTKQVVTTLSMMPIPTMVNLPRISEFVTDDGFVPPASAGPIVDEIGGLVVAYGAAASLLRV